MVVIDRPPPHTRIHTYTHTNMKACVHARARIQARTYTDEYSIVEFSNATIKMKRAYLSNLYGNKLFKSVENGFIITKNAIKMSLKLSIN